MASQKTEIIDLDLDRTFISSKNHEKELLIEDLNKQLRFQKFESDKRIKELEEALRDAKSQIKDYEKKLNDNSYIKTIKNLQESLTETEKELCKEKEKEMDYKREIYQLESGMLKLKQKHETFSKSFRKKPGNTSTAGLLNIQPIKAQTQEEGLMEKVEESTKIALEKEKELLQMKEKMNEMEVYYQTQLNSCMDQVKALQSRQNIKFSMVGGESERLRLELLVCQEDLKREKMISSEQISELNTEIQNTVAKYEQIIQKLDQEYSDKISNSLKLHLDRTQTKEVSLMDEIKKQDEDLDYLRKTNKELEKKLEFTRKQKENIENEYQRRVEALEKKDLKTEVKKVEGKYQKIMQDSQEKLESQIASKEDVIRDLEAIKSANMKKILHLEGENKKISEVNLRLQEKLLQVEKMQTESEEKFAEIIKGYETRFAELESNYEFERQTNAYFRNINRGGNFTMTKINPSEMNTPINIIERSAEQLESQAKNLSNELKGLEQANFGNFLSPARSSFINPTGSFNFVIEDDHMKDSFQMKDSQQIRDSTCKRTTSASKFKTQNNLGESFNELKGQEGSNDVLEEDKEEPKEEKEAKEFKIRPEPIEESKASLLMNESLRKFDRLEESSCLRGQIAQKDDEIETLKSENENLKQELEKLRAKWLAELESHGKKQMENVLEIQRVRDKSIDVLLKANNENFSPRSNDDPQMKKVLREKRELEVENRKLKREFQDEMEFLKEEMKKLEERNEENNQKLIKSLNEKDYFEQQWKMLVEEMKLSKMDVDREKRDSKEKKISKWLFCTCK